MNKRLIGRIVRSLSGFYDVQTDRGLIVCRARGILRKEGSTPLTGDLAEITVERERGMVERILPRKNSFIRPAVANVDALVVLPQEPGPLTNVCSNAAKQGKYLVVVDRGLTKDVQNLTIAGDNAGFGRTCAEEMAKQLGGKGDILIMEGIPCEVNTLRVDAFKEVMKKYPGIRILESQTSYWSTEKGLKLMENFLQKYPKIDAVWAGDDDVLLGALKAYEESGRRDIKLMIGGGGAKSVVKKVLDRDPLVPFNVTYPPRMIAYGVEYAVAHLKGKPKTGEKRVTIPADVITPKNAKFFYYPNSIY